MSVRKLKLLSTAVFTSVIGAAFMAGCSSGDDSTEVVNTAFDGSWRTDCAELTTFGVPEDEQPDGYIERTLTLDGAAGTYTERRQFYTDSGCAVEDTNKPSTGVSGQIQFEGNSTTQSGLEATIVRYVNDNGGPPFLVGLLYLDNNVLYRELRESTLIEDTVPDDLALSVPWRSVN